MNQGYGFFIGCFSLLVVTTEVCAQTPNSDRWTGFYLGANMGAVRSDVAMQTTVVPGGAYFGDEVDAPQIAEATNENFSQWGGLIGGFAGYDYQFNNNIVLGAQASLSSAPASTSTSSVGRYTSDPNVLFMYDQSIQTHWLGSLRLKLGLAHNAWLVYLTGGGAVTDLEYSSTYSDDNGSPGAYGQGAVSKTSYAWIFGLGSEYALTNVWTLSVEYLYTDFGTLYTTYPVIPTPALSEFGSSLNGKGSLNSVQSIMLGLSYRF